MNTNQDTNAVGPAFVRYALAEAMVISF